MKVRRPGVVIRDGVYLSGYPDSVYEQVFRQCSFVNPTYEAVARHSPWGPPRDMPETLDFAQFVDTGLRVSRGAMSFLSKDLIQLFHKCKQVTDERTSVPTKFPKLKLKLNDEQQACMEALERTEAKGQRPYGSLLFLASTAAGKTILQAAVAAHLGEKALVICPTDQIMRAWYADLRKAYGLAATSIGLIRGKSFKTNGAFVLATPQTLGRREALWGQINDTFGTIVIDETQIVTAPQLFAFLDQSPARYLVGATATQDARTGVNHHLRALMGPPVIYLNTYGHDTASSMRLSGAYLVETKFKFQHQVDNIDWHQLGLALTTDEDRNHLIVKNVIKEWSSGRVVIVVTKLREHVELLVQMLSEAGVTNVNRITGDTNAQNFYTKRLLKAVDQRRVTCIVATQQAIKIGANIPALDSLHIAIPPANQRDFEQLVGRVRRRCAGKEQATVTYYLDTKVGYMMHLFRRIVQPTFQKLQLPGFEFTSK